jgi:UDP-N-acetylmuramate dehydrogenase
VHEQTGVPLAGLTTLRLGGPAARLVIAETDDEVVETVRAADARGEPLLVLGGGSNRVVTDAGFDGTVLQVDTRGVAVAPVPEHALQVEAGVDWDHVVALAVDEGYAGIEALSGIPGRVGAAPIQNIGAYGQELAESIGWVRALDRSTGDVVLLGPDECGFGYRDSLFKRSARYVVLAVALALEHNRLGRPVQYAELARRLGVEVGERVPAADVRAAVLELRRAKGMVLDPADHDTWSAGSFFTNPLLSAEEAARLPADAPRWPAADGRVKASAAWLIERAGFGKGYGHGPVQVSGKHTLALTNRGGASADDLLALAREIRAGVLDRFGVTLVNEPVDAQQRRDPQPTSGPRRSRRRRPAGGV